MELTQTPILETDLVQIFIEDKFAFYGRVEAISTDVKPGWWRVKFLFLTAPYQVTTWILDNEQIRGSDFTMGGTPLRIEKLVVAHDEEPGGQDTGDRVSEKKPGKARVVSLASKPPSGKE